ncbi:MAG: formate acetyltransferase, partial [Clostridia bacterium]|nr:formate acetyltransferase [Clostridia bacterium]
MRKEWLGFKEGRWVEEINVSSFIHNNYTPYYGDDAFLEGPTQDTLDLWAQVSELKKQEIAAGGVLDMDTKVVSTITSHAPGYIEQEKER